MSASRLLDELLSGVIRPTEWSRSGPTPANVANPAKSECGRGLQGDSGGCEDLRNAANLTSAVACPATDSQEFAAVRNPSNRPESEHWRGSSQLSQDSQGYPRPRSIDDELSAVAWTDSDIRAFLDRRARLLRWGWPEAEAEKIAERLTVRDRDHGDDRVSCTDCRHFLRLRCGNHRGAGLNVPELSRDLAAMLQRCPGFENHEGSS